MWQACARRARNGVAEYQPRALSAAPPFRQSHCRACEVRKMADIDRTGGMMVVLFIALAAIKFFG